MEVEPRWREGWAFEVSICCTAAKLPPPERTLGSRRFWELGVVPLVPASLRPLFWGWEWLVEEVYLLVLLPREFDKVDDRHTELPGPCKRIGVPLSSDLALVGASFPILPPEASLPI